MKKSFITGLVILLPLAFTLAILNFFVNMLTDPFMGLFRSTLSYFNLVGRDFLIFNAAQIQYAASKILILVILVALTVSLGALARWYLFRSLLRLWDYTLQSIPLVRTIYKLCQDVIKTFFSADTASFQRVVLVPFPNAEAKSIGFITKDGDTSENSPLQARLTTVFVPTTPNPTSGFLLMFPEDQLVSLDMKVEEAFKYIISCGVITAPLSNPGTTGLHAVEKFRSNS